MAQGQSKGWSRAPWGLLVAVLAVIGLGVGLGAALARVMVKADPPQQTAALSPPAVETDAADPPATETSPQREVEEDPPPSPPPPPVSVPAAVPPPPQQLAMVLPPPGKSVRPLHPAWQRYALASPPLDGRPMIAIIIDDMGVDKRRSEKILQLPAPLTISFMSYAEELSRQTTEAHARGHELMMHVPMEPLASLDAGPGVLTDRQSPEELRRVLDEDLDRFTGYVGINNHMGSKFTANGPGMQLVMEALRQRGLLFIDSLTTERSVGLASARAAGVPASSRNVFLDNDDDLASVRAQLAKTEEIARRKGSAIAIGHPRDATIAALAAWLPGLAQRGFVLVPVTTVVKNRVEAP